MLPLRSRTSWRLRALTVICLPRDWTWAVLTILPTIEDADTTCPKDTTASSRNKSGLPRHARPQMLSARPRAEAE